MRRAGHKRRAHPPAIASAHRIVAHLQRGREGEIQVLVAYAINFKMWGRPVWSDAEKRQ